MALWIPHRERDREVGMIERNKLKQPWKRGEKGSIKATRVAQELYPRASLTQMLITGA